MHPDHTSHSHEEKTTLTDNHPVQATRPAYHPHPDQRADIENRFTYHSPKADQPERYTKIREKAKELALLLVETTPVSREQSLALTHLEDAVYCANASIARNE